MDKSSALRSLPAVHKLLALPACQPILDVYPASLVSQTFAEVLADLRGFWLGATEPSDAGTMEGPARCEEESDLALWVEQAQPSAIVAAVEQRLRTKFAPQLREVLNLTGVVIHTNLGRAPLSQRAMNAVARVAQGYSNLEFDLGRGQRGSRHSHIEDRICALTGAEAALVVNNNAAAVVLVLRELCAGGEAIVSRGELVEIGGSFRVPDIMKESGVQLVEVGSTNKTKVQDYAAAITDKTKMVIKVHTSNFRIVGFTEQPDLYNLVATTHAHNVPVYEDLGSGALFDYRALGIGDEPTIRESVAAGVDVISFSGDKLLGGAQAGIVIGRADYIRRMKKNPLMRALRPDKMTLAALEATLIGHADASIAQAEIPVVRMLTLTTAEVDAWANTVCTTAQSDEGINKMFRFRVIDDVSRIGGGALPTEELPTRAIQMEKPGWSSQMLFDALRAIPTVPVVARISDNRVLLDVRTLLPHQLDRFVVSLQELAVSGGEAQ